MTPPLEEQSPEVTRLTLHVCVICGTGYLRPPNEICVECGTEAEAIGPMDFFPLAPLTALIEKWEAIATDSTVEMFYAAGRRDAIIDLRSLLGQNDDQ